MLYLFHSSVSAYRLQMTVMNTPCRPLPQQQLRRQAVYFPDVIFVDGWSPYLDETGNSERDFSSTDTIMTDVEDMAQDYGNDIGE